LKENEIWTMAIQASPKWGKWGVGALIPLALLLILYNAFLLMLFASFPIFGRLPD